MREGSEVADVCLLLEGTYPYVAGGVSSWVYDLLQSHPDLSFHLVSLVPDERPREDKYGIPSNVVSRLDVPLQAPPPGAARVRRRDRAAIADLLRRLEALVRGTAGQDDLARIAAVTAQGAVGQQILLESPAAFTAMQAAYAAAAPGSSFIDFFWSWRSLVNAMLSVLLPPLPRARCYHSVSTGFAGLLGARMAAETGRGLILTEHGIYTNERRIEIAMAEWLHRGPETSLAPEKATRDLRDLWIAAFEGFARLTYAAADPIVTLYRGNQVLQQRDGADPGRLRIIPNGIDADRFAGSTRVEAGRPPTVALIGRVVPIKDVKTFIRAVGLLRRQMPDARGELLGPLDEDAAYAEECKALVAELGLGDAIAFRGRVDVADWLGRIDVNVLTSISEAQPLTILEAGSAGVPCVATDVGSCREMIEGDREAEPVWLGSGGAVTPVANPAATATAMAELLLDPVRWRAASEAMQRRVRAKFLKADTDRAYASIYAEAMAAPDVARPRAAA